MIRLSEMVVDNPVEHLNCVPYQLDDATHGKLKCLHSSNEASGMSKNSLRVVAIRLPVEIARAAKIDASSKDESLQQWFRDAAEQKLDLLRRKLHEDTTATAP